MKPRTMIAVLLAGTISSLALPACKKVETKRMRSTPTVSEQAHQQAMLSRGFEESKRALAARVNGEAVTLFALLREMNTIAPQYLKPGQERKPELDAKIREDALNIVILQALAVQQARKRGLTANADVVGSEMQKMRTEAGSPEAFERYLANNGLTERELRKVIEEDVLFEMIAAREIDKKIIISDADLKQRYDAERAGLKDAAHRQMTFAEAKGLLEQKIRTERSEKRMKEWEQELKKNARIEILRPERQHG